jgi:hypothetical protein
MKPFTRHWLKQCPTESPCRIMLTYSSSDSLRRGVSMTTSFTEVRQTFVPRGDAKHGSLPALLVVMFVIALIAIASIAVTTRVLSTSDPAWVRVS